ncbi:uncharacterized protein LOC131038954 [Cryptomeria japonica]|uniref:uncharacterized protein LOC131038954 n=1 Tax=Cryptomeria japonica TaxID=3369 RepID=UPI0027DA1153|nr:uncharacterized protein LOC131038954 [Cryptomeria japonica]XP_057827561.2 uncharacterized protein LOC131038954 [Cryptomeria japonica]XP_057827567.2 uncharacterized protein LOC131038954 [Cryptomeria japonica]XP_059063360.1 uncharacterized protein LOC131038954 [Cryptomeria japonica]
MEFFSKAKTVRLRSHHDKYLWAEEDEETVSQDRDGASKNAKWRVEFVQGSPLIRLKSCYNYYLTATDIPFLLGMTGKKVLQTLPPRVDSSVEWEPIREGFHVKLKTRYGNYLRANGGPPPWRNKVTHDIPHRTATQDWVLWEIEIMEIDFQSPPPAAPAFQSSPAAAELDPSSPISAPKPDGRLIYYAIGGDNGHIEDGYEWPSFIFKGNDLHELTRKLEEEIGLQDIIVCSQHPSTGKLFPLRLQLPPNNAPMHLVLVQVSSRLARSFI